MIGPQHFLLFFAAALILAITPGPGIFYVLARAKTKTGANRAEISHVFMFVSYMKQSANLPPIRRSRKRLFESVLHRELRFLVISRIKCHVPCFAFSAAINSSGVVVIASFLMTAAVRFS